MELRKVVLADEISDEKLRERWSHAGGNSTRYVATDKGEEVAFLAVDTIPDYPRFIIYELFVLPEFRLVGRGGWLLGEAENIGRDLGYGWSLITVRTLDDSFTQVDLEAWYRKKGYEILPDAMAEGTYIKKLGSRSASK
jgi:GNAT superfamily N-acetyltransferase